MRRKGHIVSRSRKRLPDLPIGAGHGLFSDKGLPRFEVNRNADTLIKLATMNPYVHEILRRMPQLAAPDCWLVSGAIFQSVWNVMEGRPPAQDILDYDLIYFDPDQSREAEEVVKRRAQALFDDLDIRIDIKNQARVHLWYKQKYGMDYPQLTQGACQSLRYYPARIQAIALQGRTGPRISYDAPFGFEQILTQTVRPNPALMLRSIFEDKVKRWQSVWPQISVIPWGPPRDQSTAK